MSAPAEPIKGMSGLPPREAAERLLCARRDETDWLDDFVEHLDRRRGGQSLERTLAAWDLSQSEAARLLGVSRQALGKWLRQGVPAERAAVVADLAAATDLLLRHLKRDRIPAVVRRAAANLGDRSLIDLLAEDDSAGMLRACRRMFDFDDAQA